MTTQPTQQQIDLEVLGMTCDSCALHVMRALNGVDEVIEVHVPGWASGRATVMARPDVSDAAMVEAVKDAGYRARVLTKALIRAAEAYHTAGHHPFAGVHTQAEGLDWPAVIGQKDRLVGELRQSKYLDVLASYGGRITLARGRARLQADGGVALDDGQVCRPGKVVIATGARPRILPLEGIEDVEVLDSTSAMALEVQPRSLIVIGGRAVALELGQPFARFGTRVTILQRSPRILPQHEPEISEALANYLREEGLVIHTGVTPLATRQDDGEKVVTAQVEGQRREFRAEQVLMAVGRTPNTKDMGLEEAGVELDDGGFIVVDDYMQTSHLRIYAAGDVTNRPKLVYVAAAAGGIAAENALNGDGLRCHVMSQLDCTSDHFPFLRAGMDAAHLWRWRFVGRHAAAEFHHESADTADKVNVRELKEYAGQLARLLLRLSHIAPDAWPRNPVTPEQVLARLEAERGAVIRVF